MAFTGVPVVKKVADDLYRISGVSLAQGAAGTIGPAGTAPGPADPEAVLVGCNWGPYAGEQEAVIDLGESVQVLVNPAGGASPATAVPIRVTKAANGLITLTNDDGAAATSNALEIYVRYH